MSVSRFEVFRSSAQNKVTHPRVSLRTDSELAMQLECCQTEVEFVRRRLKQTEEKLETERQTRQQLDTKVRQDAVTCTAALTAD